MTKLTEPTGWIKNKNKTEAWFMDGDRFIIAVWVKHNSTGLESWQIDMVIVSCDGESFDLLTEAGESYDDWTWFDVDYFIPVDAHGPMTKKQMEQFL